MKRALLWQLWSSALVIALITAMLGAIYLTDFFRIKVVECQVERSVCSPELQAELQKVVGESIFTTDLNGRGQRVLAVLPSMSTFMVSKELPQTVRFQFSPAQHRYVIQLPNAPFFVIDQSGTVVEEVASPPSLPIIVVTENVLTPPQLRQKLDPQLHLFLLSSTLAVTKLNLPYEKITLISPTELELQLSNGRIGLVNHEQPTQQLQKLAFVVEKIDFSSLSPPIKTIDVRFKFPILKT